MKYLGLEWKKGDEFCEIPSLIPRGDRVNAEFFVLKYTHAGKQHDIVKNHFITNRKYVSVGVSHVRLGATNVHKAFILIFIWQVFSCLH